MTGRSEPRRLAASTFACAALLFAGCDDGGSARTFTESDTRIVVEVGDEVRVRLESNVTTGYTWEIAERPAQLRLLGDRYVGPSDGRIGEGGHQVFTFRARRAGSGRLELEYVRSFESDEAPARRATFRVEVT